MDLQELAKNVFVFEKSLFWQSATGAGIVISHSRNASIILTSAHVVYKVKYRNIILSTGKKIDISGYKLLIDFRQTSENMDMCLLECKNLSSYVKSAILSEELPEIEDKFTAIGYPESKGLYTQEIVEDKILRIKNNYIFSNLNTEFGYSGAPYVNQENKIIGIHHGHIAKTGLRKGAMIYTILRYLQENSLYEFNKERMDKKLGDIL